MFMETIDVRDCHEAFGKYIKNARVRRGISQSEVAEKLGVSQPYYSRIESGQRDVDLAVAFNICTAVGVDIRDFVNRYL